MVVAVVIAMLVVVVAVAVVMVKVVVLVIQSPTYALPLSPPVRIFSLPVCLILPLLPSSSHSLTHSLTHSPPADSTCPTSCFHERFL